MNIEYNSVIKLALYEKSGVVKTTTSCNISIALAHLNKKVLQIGCKAFYYPLLIKGLQHK